MPGRNAECPFLVRFNPEDCLFEILIDGKLLGRTGTRGLADKLGKKAWADLQAQTTTSRAILGDQTHSPHAAL